MGAACSQCFESLAKPKDSSENKKVKQTNPPDSDRRLVKTGNIKEIKDDKNDSICGKNTNSQLQSNFSTKQSRSSFRGKSRILSVLDPKAIMISKSLINNQKASQQWTIDSESITVINPQVTATDFTPDQYYTVIEKCSFIKKSLDRITLTSPVGRSELNCAAHLTSATLTIAQGKPAQCILDLGQNKFIQINQSPIKVHLKLQCKNCKGFLKFTSSKGLINVISIQCVHCQAKGNWRISDIQSNATIWGEGTKIQNHQQLENAPSLLRIMGCVNCFRYANCSQMSCGCLLCNQCSSDDVGVSLDLECKMCQGSTL